MGAEPGRLPRRQHRPAPAQLPAAVAPAAAPARARRSRDRRGVRGAPGARGVGGLDHRTQGRAVRAVLPGRGAGLDPFRPDAAAGALRAGPGPVYGGAAVQIGGGDAACGALDLALVAAGEGDADRPAAHGAVRGGGGGDHGGRSVVLHVAGAAGARLFAGGAGADRGAGAVVLRRQVALAGGAGGDLSPMGNRRREAAGVGVPPCRGGVGGRAVAGAAADRTGAAGGSVVLRGHAGAGAGVRGLRLHAVLVRGRPVPVPGGHRRAGGADRRCRARGGQAAGWVPAGRAGPGRGRGGGAGHADVATGGDLPGRGDALQPRRRAQSRGARRAPQSGQRADR